MYMVDFLRGQLGIFAFKRFYDDIRQKLQQLIKTDYSRTTRLLDTPPTLHDHTHRQGDSGIGGGDDVSNHSRVLHEKNPLKRSLSYRF
jgi:hypothetical protein